MAVQHTLSFGSFVFYLQGCNRRAILGLLPTLFTIVETIFGMFKNIKNSGQGKGRGKTLG